MEYFKSGIKSVLGQPAPPTQVSGADAVEKLIDRILHSTLLDDRRDACRALKALSRTYRVEVGAHGMDALRQILDTDRTDCEIIGLALDTLCNITSPEIFDNEVDNQGSQYGIGAQFTEILIKNQETVSQLLKFLEEFDFKVRWSALKLLSNLISTKTKDVQEIILVSPMGISKLMDMLCDGREIIRNEALLLLIKLTKANTNIQKIVAFENAFDKIYDVILQEGGIEGGIVVEDCLLLLMNLLKGNYSNQNFFKEGNYIQRLTPMIQSSFDHNEDNSFIDWNPQKVSNLHCIIQVIRTVVAPSGPAHSVTVCQKIMKSCGLLQALCNVLMVNGVPTEILTETICAIAEIIRGNTSNQEYFANVTVPSNPPRSAVVVLLMSMVNEKQPFNLRCAVLYCFQCFLCKNETEQMHLVHALLPQRIESSSITTGQLICGGLFSPDSLSVWFSAVALSYALIDGTNVKEQLLRVLLTTNVGAPPVTLMEQCVMLLQQNNKIQSKLGLLILLCHWTSFSATAVRSFIAVESSITYLVAYLSSHEGTEDPQESLLQSMCAFLIAICLHFNDDSNPDCTRIGLCHLIENRIGLEKFLDTVQGISRHEAYSRTLKHPQSSAKCPAEIVLDHEFCMLLRRLESVILKSIVDWSRGNHTENHITSSNSSESALIDQYKKVIREQDNEIQNLKESNSALVKDKDELEIQIDYLRSEINLLTDQMKILRAQQMDFPKHLEKELSSLSLENKLSNQECERKEFSKNQENHSTGSLDIPEESHNRLLEIASITDLKTELQEKIHEVEKCKKDQEDLLELLSDQDRTIEKYKQKLTSLGEKFDSDESLDDLKNDGNENQENSSS